MIVRDILAIKNANTKAEVISNELALQDDVTSSKKLSQLGGGARGYYKDFIYNEDIVKSKFVNLLTTGKIETIGNKVRPQSIPYSAAPHFYYQALQSGRTSISYDPFNKNRVAITYTGFIYGLYTYGAVVIGTILDDGNIVLGPENILTTSLIGATAGVFDPLVPDRLFVSYVTGQQSYGYTRACSIKNGVVTAGPEIQFCNTTAYDTEILADPFVKGRYAIAYRNGSAYACICGVVTGDSGIIAVPAAQTVLTATSVIPPKASFDRTVSGRLLVSYVRGTTAYALVVSFVGTSGSTTFGAENLIASTSQVQWARPCSYITANKVLFVYVYATGGLMYKLGTISGTTITFGSEVQILSSMANTYIDYIQIDKVLSQKLVLLYSLNSILYIHMAGLSGDTITFESPITLSNSGSMSGMDQDPFNAGRFATTYSDSTYGIFKLNQFATTTSNLWPGYAIGVTIKDGLANISKQIQIAGLCDEFTGLVPASSYYVQSDGSISTTVSSVKAGIAISSTSMLLTI